MKKIYSRYDFSDWIKTQPEFKVLLKRWEKLPKEEEKQFADGEKMRVD